jgi:DDE family transposase
MRQDRPVPLQTASSLTLLVPRTPGMEEILQELKRLITARFPQACFAVEEGCAPEGRHLVIVLTPWASHGRAAAVDSTSLKTSGGLWHQKHKEAGEIPHTSIDTEAGWSKSGWHGWKLHLAVAVGSVWIPLAAELTPANTADNTVAPQLLAPLPAKVRYILGDTHYNDPEVRTLCEQADRALVATRRRAPGLGRPRWSGLEKKRLAPEGSGHFWSHVMLGMSTKMPATLPVPKLSRCPSYLDVGQDNFAALGEVP